MKRSVLVIVVVCAFAAVGLVAPTAAVADSTSVITDKSVKSPNLPWWWYTGVDATFISNHINANNSRVVDLEVLTSSPLTFSVRLVRNTGAYQAVGGWWWYYNATSAQVNSLTSSNGARLIDAEGYSTSSGARYAVVMIKNTGATNRAWIWRINSNVTTIFNEMVNNTWRPITAEHFVHGGTKYYVVVAIKNTGADAKSWNWFVNRTEANLNSSLTGNQRLVDLQRNSNGTWDAISHGDGLGFTLWWHGFTSAAAVIKFANQTGTRPIAIERYSVSGFTRYAGVFLDNLYSYTGGLRNRMWAGTGRNGTWGWRLERVNGSVATALLDTTQYEPASSLKVLYHLHTLIRRQASAVTDSTSVTFHYKSTTANSNDTNKEAGICPDDFPSTSTTNLKRADEQMMWVSDNRMTRAITDYFGFSAINSTGTAAGMTQTDINHNIGCPPPRNLTTSHDINRVYEQVFEDTTILNTTQRGLFFDRMLNDDNSGFRNGSPDSSTDGFCPVVRQEAAKVGKSTATADAFCNATVWMGKGGSYSDSSGFPRTVSYSTGSLTRLPAKDGEGVIVFRDYAWSSYIDLATFANQTAQDKEEAARRGVYYDALRPYVQSALNTW